MKTKEEKLDYFKLSDIVSGFHPSSVFYKNSFNFNNREVIGIYNALLTLYTTEKLLMIDDLVARLKHVSHSAEIPYGKNSYFNRGYLCAIEDLEDFAKRLKNDIIDNYNLPNGEQFSYLSHDSQRKMLQRFSELFMSEENK